MIKDVQVIYKYWYLNEEIARKILKKREFRELRTRKRCDGKTTCQKDFDPPRKIVRSHALRPS
jgi:hypothetical protein